MLANGRGFLLDEDVDCGVAPSNIFEHGSLGRSGSGLYLILEESGSLVLESPLSNLPGPSRNDLDASRIFLLQK